MTTVQFEEENQFSGSDFRSRQVLGVPVAPGMIRWLGKLGIHNEKVAEYMLVGIVVMGISLTLFLLSDRLVGSNIPPEALVEPEYGLPIKD